MTTEIIKDQMKEKIQQAKVIREWLELLYYNKTVINIMRQPALGLIIGAAKFLENNIQHMLDNYIEE